MLKSRIILFVVWTCGFAQCLHLRSQLEWKYINYTWPDEATYKSAVESKEYILKNNVISGVKQWKDRIYLSTPRWLNGVASSLNSVSLESAKRDKSPNLEPFPSWEFQKLGDCDALQFVNTMQIDPLGRMWVIDNGRVFFDPPKPGNECPQKLLILDLNDNGAILMNYTFPSDVVDPTSGYLNDLVLDHEDGGFAYIANTDMKQPGIVVFSLKDRTSWKANDKSMKVEPAAVKLTVGGITVQVPLPVDGIALSPASTEGPNRTLYYSAASSFTVYTLPTKALKDRQASADICQQVQELGHKPSQTDGMIMSNKGTLYFGLLHDNAVASWDSEKGKPFTSSQKIEDRDSRRLQWQDGFDIDQRGQLWVVTNRLQRYFVDKVNVKDVNLRVSSAKIKMQGYQYYANGKFPVLPDI